MTTTLSQKYIELEEDKKRLEEAQLGLQRVEYLNQIKRQTFYDQKHGDLEQKTKLKDMESVRKKMWDDEHRKLMDYNSRVQENRTKEFKDRFVKFNEQEKIKKDIYFNSMDLSLSKKDELSMKNVLNSGGILNSLYH